MIRTKTFITREIKNLEAKKEALIEELSLLNNMAKQVGKMPFTSTKRVIQRELILIEGKIAFANWVANTSEKSLPKVKDGKKKRKEKKKGKQPEYGFDLKKTATIAVYPKQKEEPVKPVKK